MRRAVFSLFVLLPLLAAPACGQWSEPVPVPHESTSQNYQFIITRGDTFRAFWTSGRWVRDSAVAYASWTLRDSWSEPESIDCTHLALSAAVGVDGEGRVWFLRYDGDIILGQDYTSCVVASVRESSGWRNLHGVLRPAIPTIQCPAVLEFAADRIGRPWLGIGEHVHEANGGQYWSARMGRLQGDTCTWPGYVVKGDTAPNERVAIGPLLEPRPDSGLWSACYVWDSAGRGRVCAHVVRGDTAFLLHEFGRWPKDAAVDSSGRLWVVYTDSVGQLWSATVDLDSTIEHRLISGQPGGWDVAASICVDNEGWVWCAWLGEDSTLVTSWNRGGAWSAPERAADSAACYSRLVPDSRGLVRLFFSDVSERWYCVRRLSRPGVEEDPTAGEPSAAFAATVLRGVLRLPPSSHGPFDSPMLDAAGRKVMELRSGPNDVRHLAPGVYFVKTEGSRVQEVIVAR